MPMRRWTTSGAVLTALLYTFISPFTVVIGRDAGAGVPAPALYVAPGGDDSTSCASPSFPCASIQAAATRVAIGGTVVVAAGVYTETLRLSRAVTIAGAGPSATTVDGASRGSVVAVGPAATVHLQGVTLRHGRAAGGGGIANKGRLVLDHVTVIANTAAGEGGGIANTGVLTLRDSVVSGNDAQGADGGGGIANGLRGLRVLSGRLTVSNSVVARNTTTGAYGGGILDDAGTMTLEHDRVDTNTAPAGAGLAVFGAATIEATTIQGNRAVYVGGGVFNADSGAVTLTATTVASNTAAAFGGVANQGIFDVMTSTVAFNVAVSGAGGGIGNGGDQTPAFMHVTNSTISRNKALGPGGGAYNEDRLRLNRDTIEANTTGGAGGGLATNALGGVVLSSVTIRNMIVAANVAATYTDCDAIDGPSPASYGYNLVGDGAGCTFDARLHDKVGTRTDPLDPRLSRLQGDSLHVLTLPPLRHGPARGAGTPTCGISAGIKGSCASGASRPRISP